MDDTQLDIRAIFGVIRRQLRLIIGVIVIVLGLAAVGTFSLKPGYTASTLILVDTSKKDLLDATNADPLASTASARVDSEVELAKSPTVLMRVVKEQNLSADPQFAPQPGLVDRILSLLRLKEFVPPTGAALDNQTFSKLKDAVSVQRRGLTFLIAVQVQSQSPAEAAALANAVSDTYVDEQVQAKIASVSKSRDVIQAQIAAASQTVADSEDAIDKFIAANIAAIAQETGRSDLQSLYDAVSKAKADRSQLLDAITQADASFDKRDWLTLSAALPSDAVKSLEAEREQKVAALQTAATGSPGAVALRAELAKVEDQLANAAQQAIGNLKNQVSSTQATLSDQDAQLRSEVLSSNLSSGTLTKIYELQQNAKIAQTQYNTLLTRLNDLEAQTSLQVADSRVVSAALPPNEPSFPNPRLLLALAAVLALGLGIGLAFLYENVIGGVVNAEQLQALVKGRRTLVIPRQREPKGGGGLADLMTRAPLSVFAEAIRKVRLGVDQSIRRHDASGGRRGQVILVTSAAPAEGKTTLSLSLARAYAQSGQTTLLIDCDLRKPSVHRQLGWEPSTGLIDYLSADESSETGSLLSVVKIDESSGIGVLVGSRRSSMATDALVAGSRFGRLVEAASKAFEIVVLDTPPVEPIVDGAYLAQFADAIVFVVKWASTTQREIKRATTAIAEAAPPSTEMVLVLNQADGSARRYGGKYGYYYTEPA